MLSERDCVEHRIDPLEFDTFKQEWEKNNTSLIIAQKQLDQEIQEIQQMLEKTQIKEKETRKALMVL
jgi:Tfp pilus assembly protein PilN